MSHDPRNLVWIDLEMKGLDPYSDHIIEIATVITDHQLNVIEEGPAIAWLTQIRRRPPPLGGNGPYPPETNRVPE